MAALVSSRFCFIFQGLEGNSHLGGTHGLHLVALEDQRQILRASAGDGKHSTQKNGDDLGMVPSGNLTVCY